MSSDNETQEKALNTSKSPVVDVAKEVAMDETEEVIVMLTTGVKAKLTPVTASLISDVTSRIKDPEVPWVHNPDKPTTEHPEGRMEQNPNDPNYVRELSETAQRRGLETINAMVMFGVTLLDDSWLQDKSWLTKLKYMEKRGSLDLSGYDLDDLFDLEFLFKRYIGCSSDILEILTEMSGVSTRDVDRAERSFQRRRKR